MFLVTPHFHPVGSVGTHFACLRAWFIQTRQQLIQEQLELSRNYRRHCWRNYWNAVSLATVFFIARMFLRCLSENWRRSSPVVREEIWARMPCGRPSRFIIWVTRALEMPVFLAIPPFASALYPWPAWLAIPEPSGQDSGCQIQMYFRYPVGLLYHGRQLLDTGMDGR